MNGFERIEAALRGEKPDKVPVFLHNFMMAAREAGYSQQEFRSDPKKAADTFIQATEKYDLDGVLLDFDTATIAGALGVPVDFPENEPARCEGALLHSLADIDSLAPPNVAASEHLQIWLETMRLLKDHFGDEKFLRGNVDQAPFSIASMIRTPAEWMMDLIDEENAEAAHRLLDYCTEASCQFIQLMSDAGAHMVSTGDSPAGPDMISPAMYREFARPYEDRMAERAHQNGIKYLLHICGDTSVILDQFTGRPVDAVELDYKTNVQAAHDILLDAGVSFWGNIDPSGILARGTPEDAYRESTRLIELFSDFPGFVLCSGCALPSTTPSENIRAMLSAAGR